MSNETNSTPKATTSKSAAAKERASASSTSTNSTTHSRSLDMLMHVPVQISVELGRKKVRIADLLQLGPGATLELPTLAGDPLDIRVNDKLIAKGEAVSIGEMYGVRVIEVVNNDFIPRKTGSESN